jgi:hypothetical protein
MTSTATRTSSLLLLCFASWGSLLSACAGSKAAEPKASSPRATSSATPPDRMALVADLEESRRAFLDSVKGLSEAQLRYKTAPDRWSIAEVAEHIALAEERIFNNITAKVMKSPLTDELRAQIQADDGRIRRTVTDRSSPRQAPEALRPTGRFPTMPELLAAFEASRARTLDYARNGQVDLRGHAAPHPALGVIDGYQWLLFLSAHCSRHTAQILEVKAAPGFPRS